MTSGLNQSKVMIETSDISDVSRNVIDSNDLERDAGGKPVPTFPHPALAGRISVSLEVTQAGLAEILVIDNGKGFPKDHRNRLLEPYVTTRAEGTGLGLAIVAKILEDHGGGLELLDSPEGRGAVVRLYFPCSDGAHSAADFSVEELTAVASDESPS